MAADRELSPLSRAGPDQLFFDATTPRSQTLTERLWQERLSSSREAGGECLPGPLLLALLVPPATLRPAQLPCA